MFVYINKILSVKNKILLWSWENPISHDLKHKNKTAAADYYFGIIWQRPIPVTTVLFYLFLFCVYTKKNRPDWFYLAWYRKKTNWEPLGSQLFLIVFNAIDQFLDLTTIVCVWLTALDRVNNQSFSQRRYSITIRIKTFAVFLLHPLVWSEKIFHNNKD